MIKLMQSDCLERMRELPDGSVDAIICDPPYQITNCKWDKHLPFKPMWEQLKRLIKPNGAIVLFGAEPFSSALRMSNLEWYKYDWVWEKTQATGHFNAKKRPLSAHEMIYIFYQKQCIYNPQKTQGHKPINNYIKRKDMANKTQVYGKVNKDISGGGRTDRFPRSVQVF